MKEKTEGGELGQLKDVNVRNGSGWTALDIHFRVAESESEKSEDKKSKAYRDIGDVLRDSGVNKSDKLFFPFDPYWEKKKNETLMIVSSLMATILFQVGIIPPGSVWADFTGTQSRESYNRLQQSQSANRRKQNAGNGGKLVRPKEVVVALEE
ncbi:hypothetical protein RHMOL_Rhmol01G0039200 [Rhododendron molle]|uniref:Uncharacterized protein n=1 Tax=Rhododendron molle TaxID=49168 RepID=A0ACC0PZB3_RHOML|nr:hypothetical protein RHMOL_Rhmol01G0039200 [Rhododendron molle]